MAYINQETKKLLTPAIQAVLKKHNMKGSIGVRDKRALVVTIASGAFDFFKNEKKQYSDVNIHWIDTGFPEAQHATFLKELLAAMKGNIWYDKSDGMRDCFDTAYYMDINIGSYDKPYRVA